MTYSAWIPLHSNGKPGSHPPTLPANVKTLEQVNPVELKTLLSTCRSMDKLWGVIDPNAVTLVQTPENINGFKQGYLNLICQIIAPRTEKLVLNVRGEEITLVYDKPTDSIVIESGQDVAEVITGLLPRALLR